MNGSEVQNEIPQTGLYRSSLPHPCPICECSTESVGAVTGSRTKRAFHLQKCQVCQFVFVTDPWTDYSAIYDDAYYRGEGSDPLVDYAFEFASPERTIRRYEWRGVEQIVRTLLPQGGKWLDYGCGNGGLVRFAQASVRYQAFGYDTGSWAEKARQAGLPILNETELATHEGTFDVITAVEVLEHLVDPVSVLKRLRRLLKPGGILFLTTGNAEKAPADIKKWSYVQPEIHVSYFNPAAIEIALRRSGFATRLQSRGPGWRDIIRFKCLKNLGVKKRNALERVLPWRPIAAYLDRRYEISAFPVGIAQ